MTIAARIDEIERRCAANNDHELSDRHRRELEASGLTPESIAASGCDTAEQTKSLLRWPQSWKERGPGLVFPYPATDGQCKVKLDDPRREGEGRRRKRRLEGFRWAEVQRPTERGNRAKNVDASEVRVFGLGGAGSEGLDGTPMNPSDRVSLGSRRSWTSWTSYLVLGISPQFTAETSQWDQRTTIQPLQPIRPVCEAMAP